MVPRPSVQGALPRRHARLYKSKLGKLDFIQPGDEKECQAPTDFLGVNFYERRIVSAKPKDPFEFNARGLPGTHRTEMNWEVTPEAMSDLLQHVTQEYGQLPIYITENGAAFVDPPIHRGRIHDQERTDFIRDHLKASLDAIDHGVNLKGYYAWSLMDNFEWAFGFDKRFGIVGVDFETQKRTLKDSALYLRGAIDRNAPWSGVEGA